MFFSSDTNFLLLINTKSIVAFFESRFVNSKKRGFPGDLDEIGGLSVIVSIFKFLLLTLIYFSFNDFEYPIKIPS